MALGVLHSVMAVLIYMVLFVSGSYDLTYMLDSYSIQNGICGSATCTTRCPSYCNLTIFICDRPAGTPVSYEFAINQGGCDSLTSVRIPSTSISTIQSSHTVSSSPWPEDGVQLHIEARSGSDIVDRFAINITGTPGTMIERASHSGIFEKAVINISYTLACTENHLGPRCEQLCFDRDCPCEPGFTGVFCATSINDCVSASCEENQTCVDGHLNYTCTCGPGHTCSTDYDSNEPLDICADANCGENEVCERMDDNLNYTCVVCEFGLTGDQRNCATACEGVDCGNGECVLITINEVMDYTCVCYSGFTDGRYCFGSTTPDVDTADTMTIIITSLAVVASAVIILAASIVIAVCLVRCIRMRRGLKSIDESTVTSPSTATITTTSFFEQSNNYDYPIVRIAPIARDRDIEPRAYETIQRFDYGHNPSYGIHGANQANQPNNLNQQTGEDEDQIYY